MTLAFSVSEPPTAATQPRDSAWVVGTLLLIVASVWLSARLRRWWGRRARMRRAARAQAAERDARSVLAEHGFRVVGRQVRQSWGLVADGEPLEFTLIADYLVERAGRRWVAEVKTGERALDLRHGPTRRQLLEYREAFAADGVLLVDAEGRRLHDVRFFGAGPAHPESGLVRLALGVAAGVGVGVVIGMAVALGHARPAAAPVRAASITPEPASPSAPSPASPSESAKNGEEGATRAK